MFERYTEKARRVIFFARYEASSMGSAEIETEHLLLGVLRENKDMLQPVYGASLSDADLRDRIVAQYDPRRAAVSTSVDVPLTHESKRVLGFGAEEAEAMGHHHIGTEHLLLGLLREEGCLGAELLRASGLRLVGMREKVRASTFPGGVTRRGQGIGAWSSNTMRWDDPSEAMRMEVTRVMTYAAEEARAGGSPISAWHLLLGLLRNEGSEVAAVLRESGLSLQTLRERVRKMDGATE